MNLKRKLRFLLLALLLGTVGLSAGCVYYNTFYNAKKAFNEAESARKKKGGRVNTAQYKKAIEKSLKITDNYPHSKYYDDALYVLGVSYYFTEEYLKAERRLRELTIDYSESEYAKDAQLYLAKTKLQLGDMEEAMQLFGNIFESKYSRNYKAEAAIALGDYNFEAGKYEEANKYFQAVRDSLGDENTKKKAQIFIADGYFNTFKFKDALGGYLQVLGMQPDKDEKYHALYRAAICSYRMQRINDGMSYLTDLIDDEMYFDSLGALLLQYAEGYEYDDDLEMAEATYEQVTNTISRKNYVGEAYYDLGLIYQYDYDNLKEAKQFYDKAVENTRGSEIGQLALQRSSAIGKLETFSKTIKVDTAATQEVIDEMAYTQYLLAELYWFDLNKPDSAIYELEYLIDSFSTSYDAPKAMIALSQMYKEYYEDTTKADSLLKAAIFRYPHSDYVPEALSLLGLRGTAADTGYAAYYFSKAEDFLVDMDQVDSALYYFQYIVDHFPDSKFYLHARFNTILTRELYESPGDSSIVLAYEEFIDSFPTSEFAQEAEKRVKYVPQKEKTAPQETTPQDTLFAEVEAGEGEQQPTTPNNGSNAYTDYQQSLYLRPNGDTLALLEEEPTEIIDTFVFPSEAYGMQVEGFYLYFQILLDFSGKVVDYVLKNRSEYDEINTRAEQTVGSMTFDPLAVSKRVNDLNLPEDPEGRGHWFVYKFLVQKPDFLR
jgi:tetratricopeptide (TPR) repeat protein